MNSIEEDGVWFLPNNPEKQVAGRLTFSEDKPPKLYLLDQLQELKFDNIIPSQFELDVINEYLVNGKKVTLCHCYQSIGFKTGIQTSEIYAKYLLVGHHFKTLKEVSFKDVALRYKNLEDWIKLPNFEVKWSTNEGQNQVKEIDVKQTTLETIELGKLLGFSLILYDKSIELMRLQLANLFGNIGRKITLEERKSVIIRADVEKSLEDIIDVIYLFQDLLIFASGQITYPYEIQSSIVVIEKEFIVPEHLALNIMAGLIEPTQSAKSDLGFEIHTFGEEIKAIEEEKEKIISIEIYFQIPEVNNLEVSFDPRRVLFDFKKVKEQFSELLGLWEQNSKELKSIIDIYLRLTYIPKRHINDFFLSLAQAIEAFHSLAHNGRYINEQVYKKVVKEILKEAVNSIPDSVPLENGEEPLDLREYKKILKGEKFSQLNSYSLGKRLEEIISEYGNCLPDNFFASLGEQDIFLKNIKNTRNYLTHLSSKKDKYVVSGQDLLILSRKLKVLLEVCLLKQLGLKDLDIKTITRNHCN
ncbi:HEPN domain-containing protein [Synechocystis sp. PCC 7509]|uniref:ApeA N-terminal domain 1-containing protein n=1 Tax=Synechocystis sp. PCC 7509 TaxID=927677 RepID=UPI0002ACF666|nr:HEPN domain-containing protein [Synechocystis sp. PCC 7509]